jgi:hypothetical protein
LKNMTDHQSAPLPEVECVDPPVALQIVQDCVKHVSGTAVDDMSVKVGDLFPGEARLNFCSCVSKRSGVKQFSCGPDDTLQDVIIGISC